MMGLIKIAGLSAALAAGFVGLANLPQEAKAAPAGTAALAAVPAGLPAPATAARLPQDPVAARPELRLRRDDAGPSEACARETWPYISPACMAERRPARRVRVIDPDTALAPAPAAAPVAAPVAASGNEARPEAKPVPARKRSAAAPRRSKPARPVLEASR